jgi:predicted lysophospholipase L1 biosynthesis ABC-type transport system permease subunit
MADEESPEERLNRKWQDQLQELRVMQTGAQLTAGFLLTLPFQQTFADLTTFQRGLYLALVALAGLTVLLVVTPVAVHRRVSGEGVKQRVVGTAHAALQVALVSLALLIAGMLTLIFHVVVGGGVGIAVGVVALVVEATLLVALPVVMARGT